MHRILIAALLSSAAFAQPAFDVASVHAIKGEGSRRENIQAEPGSLIMRAVTLKSAIRWAYNVMSYQVSGPEWMNFDRYDISAKAAGPVPEDQLRLMLQTLLADRFQLVLHRQNKELQAYELVIAKGGIKFHESKIDGDPVFSPDKTGMTVEVKGVPASQFVDMLSNLLHAPVVNETGLNGRYDVSVNIAKYMPDVSSGAAFDPISMVLTALQQELGLKLESRKMALDLLIVDHAEKAPSDN